MASDTVVLLLWLGCMYLYVDKNEVQSNHISDRLLRLVDNKRQFNQVVKFLFDCFVFIQTYKFIYGLLVPNIPKHL